MAFRNLSKQEQLPRPDKICDQPEDVLMRLAPPVFDVQVERIWTEFGWMKLETCSKCSHRFDCEYGMRIEIVKLWPPIPPVIFEESYREESDESTSSL